MFTCNSPEGTGYPCSEVHDHYRISAGVTKTFDRSYRLHATGVYDTKLPNGGCGGEWLVNSLCYKCFP